MSGATFQDLFGADDDDMYPLEVTLQGKTAHSKFCKAAFGRLDWHCARCCELMVGAAPRQGWQQRFFRRKLNQLQRRLF